MTDQHPVKIGQIWESCDKRYPDARVQIVRIYEDRGYALCVVLKNSKFRRIQLKRFRERSNGYKLIKDASPSDAVSNSVGV